MTTCMTRIAAAFAAAAFLTTAAACAPSAGGATPASPGAAPQGRTPAAAPPAAPASSSAARPAPAAGATGASPISEASIRAHMEFLASDALNGRGSGTRDEWIAATYIASQFRQWGLEPMGDNGGFVQQVDIVREQVTAPPTMTAGDLPLVHGQQILVTAIGPSVSASGPLVKPGGEGPVPAGAAVLLPDGAAPGAAAGAAVVMIRATEAMLGQWQNRAGRLPAFTRLGGVTPAPRPATVYLDEATYAAVSALDAGTTVRLAASTEAADPTHTWNAVGRLTGSDPARASEVIVLSAHLDHTGARDVAPGEDGIYNGADDDASGTVAVMALARALAAGPRPARTVVFALFGSEERGGMGASYFVDRPVVPLDRIVADLQFEMLGRPDELVPPHTLWLTGFERSDLGERLAAEGARLVADPRPEQRFFTRSDNIRFARRGIVAHTVSSFGLHTDYHRPSDDVETIDFAHMTDAIRSLLAPVRWLANSTFRPSWRPGGCPDPCGR